MRFFYVLCAFISAQLVAFRFFPILAVMRAHLQSQSFISAGSSIVDVVARLPPAPAYPP